MQSMGSQRIGHNQVTELMYWKMQESELLTLFLSYSSQLSVASAHHGAVLMAGYPPSSEIHIWRAKITQMAVTALFIDVTERLHFINSSSGLSPIMTSNIPC